MFRTTLDGCYCPLQGRDREDVIYHAVWAFRAVQSGLMPAGDCSLEPPWLSPGAVHLPANAPSRLPHSWIAMAYKGEWLCDDDGYGYPARYPTHAAADRASIVKWGRGRAVLHGSGGMNLSYAERRLRCLLPRQREARRERDNRILSAIREAGAKKARDGNGT